MIMPAPIRKIALTAHVTTSVGWLGALGVFLAHAVVSVLSEDNQMVRAAALAMAVTAWYVILPLSLGSLTTGIIQSLGTTWGLVRHYWVAAKLVLTLIATIVLLMKLSPISELASLAGEPVFASGQNGLRISLLVHAAGGLLVLLGITVLGIFKPRGLTKYGVTKLRGHGGPDTGGEAAPSAPIPRWVKLLAGIVIFLFLVVAIMLIGGDHGPGAHLPGGG